MIKLHRFDFVKRIPILNAMTSKGRQEQRARRTALQEDQVRPTVMRQDNDRVNFERMVENRETTKPTASAQELTPEGITAEPSGPSQKGPGGPARVSSEPTTEDVDGYAELHRAASNGDVDKTRSLLANPDILPYMHFRSDRTPLYNAAENGHTDIVELLLNCEWASPNLSCTDTKSSALHAAAANGHLGVVLKLLEHDSIDCTLEDEEGHTPLDIAEAGGHTAIVNALRKKVLEAEFPVFPAMKETTLYANAVAYRKPPINPELIQRAAELLGGTLEDLIGWTRVHAVGPECFVRSADGDVRRFPRTPMSPSENYIDQVTSGFIYDSHKQFKRPGDTSKGYIRAGFELTKNDARASFVVNGKPCAPVFRGKGGWEVYPLGNGKYMIPQPTFYSCTHACEMMLLLERGKISLDELIKELPHGNSLVDRRRNADMLAKLNNRPQCKPIEITGTLAPNGDNRPFLDQLREGLRKHGSCMLSLDGHVRMLDKIEDENTETLLTLRDPFHTTCDRISITGNDNFWKHPDGSTMSPAASALFLP